MPSPARPHAQNRARKALLSLLTALPDEVVSVQRFVPLIGDSRSSDRWSDLFDEAMRHGVLGVIAPHIREFDLPPEVGALLAQRTAIQEIWHQHLVSSLEQAASALNREGLRACALKGPVLAARIYPDPRARPSVDLDLLVRPADLDHAERALRELGYHGDSGVSASYLRRHGHHLHFSKPGMAGIELHFHAYAGFGVVLPAESLMDRAAAYRLAQNVEVLIPTPEDEVMYLAIHAAGHSFIRLLWLYDLKLLLRQHRDVDWDRIAARAEAAGIATAVAYALRLLETWLGVPVPLLPRALQRRGVRPKLADRLLTEVSTPQDPSARDNFGGLIFTSLLCDTMRSGAWLLQHHLGRTARRRLKRLAPAYLPEQWSA